MCVADWTSAVVGRVAPLPSDDIDTDQIIPAQFLKVTQRASLGRYLFYRWRYNEAGKLTRSFVLDRPEFQGAKILAAGRDFGIGSSRENAVWALQGAGIECVIASSFGDIFYNNASKNGLLCIVLGGDQLVELRSAAEGGSANASIDLVAQTLSYARTEIRFEIENHIKQRLLANADDIAVTISQYEEVIRAHEARAPAYTRPRMVKPVDMIAFEERFGKN